VKYEAPKVSSSSSSSKSGSGSGPKLTKIEKLLAEGFYLGPCDNACRNSNASFPAPPPCLTLVVDLTADNFGSETSWSVTDLFTGDVILSFPNGSVASGSVTSTDTLLILTTATSSRSTTASVTVSAVLSEQVLTRFLSTETLQYLT
jgi:hypothetical protein